MKVIAIITARMRSTRLPGKSLLPLAGKPVLWWIAARILHCRYVDDIIIATTNHKANIPIADNHYLPFGSKVFQYKGEEDDVISRVLACAKWAKANIIVDITGDCPLIDPRHIDYLINKLKKGDYDYTSNCSHRTWPDGLDIQVYKTKALEKVKNKFNPEHHTGWNIAQHPEVFKTYNRAAPMSMHWPELGLTLDTPEDYELLKIIFDKFGNEAAFKIEDVIMFLRATPELLKINKNVRRKIPEEG